MHDPAPLSPRAVNEALGRIHRSVYIDRWTRDLPSTATIFVAAYVPGGPGEIGEIYTCNPDGLTNGEVMIMLRRLEDQVVFQPPSADTEEGDDDDAGARA